MNRLTGSGTTRLILLGAATGLLLIGVALWLGSMSAPRRPPLALSQVAQAMKAGTLKRLTVIGPRLIVDYRDGTASDEARIEPGVSVFKQLAPYGIGADRFSSTEVVVSEEGGLGRWLTVALSVIPLV